MISAENESQEDTGFLYSKNPQETERNNVTTKPIQFFCTVRYILCSRITFPNFMYNIYNGCQLYNLVKMSAAHYSTLPRGTSTFHSSAGLSIPLSARSPCPEGLQGLLAERVIDNG